jgi:hypothetical protein
MPDTGGFNPGKWVVTNDAAGFQVAGTYHYDAAQAPVLIVSLRHVKDDGTLHFVGRQTYTPDKSEWKAAFPQQRAGWYEVSAVLIRNTVPEVSAVRLVQVS